MIHYSRCSDVQINVCNEEQFERQQLHACQLWCTVQVWYLRYRFDTQYCLYCKSESHKDWNQKFKMTIHHGKCETTILKLRIQMAFYANLHFIRNKNWMFYYICMSYFVIFFSMNCMLVDSECFSLSFVSPVDLQKYLFHLHFSKKTAIISKRT